MIAETKLIDDKQLREQYINRLDILDKVKMLFLIPKLDCMTVQQVAEYYEVDVDTVKKCYQRNKDEFISDGANKYPLSDIRSLIGTKCPNLKTTNYRGRMEIVFDENTKLVVPNVGIILFSKRAILRMGMLLRDSAVAKEVRTQLLNIVETTQEEKPELITQEIQNEENLLMNIGKAFATGDIMQFATATQKYTEYQNRHIKRLLKENEQINTEKKLLAADILTWTDRASANRLVRALAGRTHNSIGCMFGLIYKELHYKYHINVKARGNKPWIQHLKDDEWIYLYKVVAAICETNNVNIYEFFKDAKINIDSLCL